MNTYIRRLYNRSEKNYKPIDGIRSIGLLWVITGHTWLFQYRYFSETSDKIFDNPFLIWISKGDLAVEFFFIISGFLIGSMLFKEFKKTNTINFKKFYVRRFLRLLPVYVFAMIIGLYFLRGTQSGNWRSAWANLLYINNYVHDTYMGWTWSLAIEEQFYIVIPFIIAFLIPQFKNKAIPFGIFGLITIGLTYHYSVNIFDFKVPFKGRFGDADWMDWFWGYYVLTHLRYGGLLCGIIGAYLHVYHLDKILAFFKNKTLVPNVIFVVCMVCVLLISSISLGEWTNLKHSIFDGLPLSIPRGYEIIHREIFAYAVMFIILSCLYLDSKVVRPINSFLSMKFFFPIAQISYSGYLFHAMFMLWFFPIFNGYAIGRLTEAQIILSSGLLSLVAVIFGATLMYLFVEQPFQDIRNGLNFDKKITKPTEEQLM